MSLACFKEFSCPSFDYQTSFGSRIIPTKREALALPVAALPVAASLIPLGSIVVKKRDPEAEAVAKKAIEESREEDELQRMKRFNDLIQAKQFLCTMRTLRPWMLHQQNLGWKSSTRHLRREMF